MLKTLLKAKFYEVFRGLTINNRNGKKRSKASTIGVIVLFVFCFISLGFAFFGMSMIVTPFLHSDNEWLFFSLFSIIAIALGVFINAFLAMSSIYKAKDNDLLLSMPIKPGYILFSRMAVLYVLSLAYMGCVWIPVCINYWINGTTLLATVLQILSLLLMGLLSTMLSCVIGYMFALISSKARNKTFVTILSSISVILIWYLCSFRLEDLFASFIVNADKAILDIKKYGYLFYLVSKGSTGDILSFIEFGLISLLVFFVGYYILSKTFIKLATVSDKQVKVSKTVKYTKTSNVKAALLKREFKHFLNSPAMIMNLGLGVFIVIALGIGVFIKRNDIAGLYLILEEIMPGLSNYIPIAICVSILLIVGMDCISTPSISLEGKNLWILKVLPINPNDIFVSKELLHLLINGIPSILVAILMSYFFNVDYRIMLYILILIIVVIDVEALFGLIIGVLRPNFNWTNETQPIKQSLNVLFSMMFSFVYLALISLGFYLTMNTTSIDNYLYTVIIISIVIDILLRRWIRSKGCKVLSSLN